MESMATLPDQSVVLWHFTQKLLTRWSSGLGAAASTLAASLLTSWPCATPAESASQATGTQAAACFRAYVKNFRLWRIPRPRPDRQLPIVQPAGADELMY